MRRRRACALVAALGVVAGCQPGTPATGFGDGGTVVLAGAAGAVSAVPTDDGGVVVVRGDGELVKLAEDGSVVAGWGGAVPVPCAERDEVDRDGRGRALLACTSTAGDGARVTALVRYTAAGRLDRRFVDAGVVRLAGQVEGAAAVPLPGGRVLAMGGRPAVAGAPPVLVTTVLDRRGAVVSTEERELDLVDIPPEFRAGTAVTVVAEPLADGAVAAVHASTLLTVTDRFRPTDPFLVVVDRAGAEVARLDGPSLHGGPMSGSSAVVSLAEVAPGRIAVLEDWYELSGPHPSVRTDETVHVYGPDGTEDTTFTPVGPPTAEAPEGAAFTARTLAATDGGRHVLVGGARQEPDGPRGGVARYATATGALALRFGRGGMATVGPADVEDLDVHGDAGPIDVTGPAAVPAGPTTAAVVTRLWGGPTAPA